jgi:hypothetical protein
VRAGLLAASIALAVVFGLVVAGRPRTPDAAPPPRTQAAISQVPLARVPLAQTSVAEAAAQRAPAIGTASSGDAAGAAAHDAAPLDAAGAARHLLDAIRDGASPGARLALSAVREQLRIGRDHAALSIESERAGYAYLFAIGPDDRVVQLFPNALDSDNRVAARLALALPRRGWSIEPAGPAGTERLVAVVSPVPRDWSRAGLAPGETMASFDPRALARALRAGDTEALVGRIECPPPAASCGAYASAELLLRTVER